MKSKGIIQGVRCKRCGKIIRHDYNGLCMDCADELGISEIFEKSKGYKRDLEKAKKEYKLL